MTWEADGGVIKEDVWIKCYDRWQFIQESGCPGGELQLVALDLEFFGGKDAW